MGSIQERIVPAITVLSRHISEEHLLIATSVKQILQRYKELQDVIAILGLEELCNQDRVIVNYKNSR